LARLAWVVGSTMRARADEPGEPIDDLASIHVCHERRRERDR